MEEGKNIQQTEDQVSIEEGKVGNIRYTVEFVRVSTTSEKVSDVRYIQINAKSPNKGEEQNFYKECHNIILKKSKEIHDKVREKYPLYKTFEGKHEDDYGYMKDFMKTVVSMAYKNLYGEVPKKALIKAGIHLIEQFYGDPKQSKIFSDLEDGWTFKERMEEHIKTLGLTAQDTPKGYGAILNQTTKQVLEGILKKFTETDYMGDYTEDITSSLEGTNTATNIKESQRARQRIEKIYPGEKIPVIRFNSQADLIRMAGFDSTGYNREHVEQAIKTLISEQFCFYWKRLKYEKGRPVINKQSGKYEMEEVMEIGPFFRHRTIRDNDKNISFELLPSAPLIDQINSYYGGGRSGYFILFPEDWRQQVKKITGKTPPSYTIEFLMWLRLQYAHIQRYNTRLEKAKERKKRMKESPRKYEIKKTWEEMAIILQMPESMYKKNRKRAQAIIRNAYETAVKVGYLLKVKNNGASDSLY